MALWYSRFNRRATRTFAVLSVAVFLVYYLGPLDLNTRRYDTWPWEACPGLSPFAKPCTASRAMIAQDVQVVIKTGGSEPQSRLRSQLATLLSQVPPQNVFLFSDMEEEVDSYRVHDVYANIPAPERAKYPEFALYDLQQEYQRQGKDTRSMEGGWDLAKYMNLAMIRNIWTMQQGSHEGGSSLRKWYVFIDTDTFVDWDNLLVLLEHHDAAEKIYIGSPVWLPQLQFAHGGNAYALSYGALKALNGPRSQDPNMPFFSQYGFNTSALCCGDEALAWALKPKGVRLQGYWPMLNGEVPAGLTFGKDLWCEPVISLHHLGGGDLEALWLWAEEWKVKTKSRHPFLFKDLFQYIAPQISNVQEDWDNTQEHMKIYPKKKESHISPGHCKLACEADGSCFQFVYDGTTCAISNRIRLGRRRLPEEDGARRYISGWNTERIRNWTTKTDCADAHWVKSNP